MRHKHVHTDRQGSLQVSSEASCFLQVLSMDGCKNHAKAFAAVQTQPGEEQPAISGSSSCSCRPELVLQVRLPAALSVRFFLGRYLHATAALWVTETHAATFRRCCRPKVAQLAGNGANLCRDVWLSLKTPADLVSALCRAALHLQLTTELVTAAAAAGAEDSATESMWQHTGAQAIQDATAWALDMLAALAGCGLERPLGEATACPH